MINGVLLDSIGLALFSLAWWGWLIGGGLAVVGMLFGVHVAVGAPEAQAYSSSSYTLEEAAARGDVGAMAQLQLQSQPGYNGPASDPMQPSYEQQLYDDFNRGDISAGVKIQQLEQEKYYSSSSSPSSSSASSSSNSSGSGSSGGYLAPDGSTWVSKAAYDDFHRDYDAEYAQWQKDMAAWEAQYGSGGGGSAPAAPSSPGQPNWNSTEALYSGSLSAQFPDPYGGSDASDQAWEMYKMTHGADYHGYKELNAEAKRQFDHGKPLVMKVQTTGYEQFTQTFVDLAQGSIQGEGQINHEAAKLAASALVAGEIEKHGGIDAALENAQAVQAHQASMYQHYVDNPPASNDEFADPSENLAMATIAGYLVEALNQELEAAEAEKQTTVTPRKTKRGAKVLNSEIGQDGRMSATVKTKLKEGSTAQVAVHSADANGAWKEETSKVKVGKGGVVNFSTDVEKNNYVYLENSKGKMLVRWTTA